LSSLRAAAILCCKKATAAGMLLSIGMVVDYRDRQGRLTDSLQDFWLGEIGE
jgi:hypothetical protein